MESSFPSALRARGDGDDSVLRRIAITETSLGLVHLVAEARKVTSPDIDGLRDALRTCTDLASAERVSRLAPRGSVLPIVLADGRRGVHIEVGRTSLMLGPSNALSHGPACRLRG